jgi:hypothetical protein
MSPHNTRPAEGSPEELIWLRGYEAGVIQYRADQAKASEAIQDARRSSIQSLIQKGIERDEEMRALQARCDKLEAAAGRLVRDPDDHDGKKWRWVRETDLNDLRSALSPKENEDE